MNFKGFKSFIDGIKTKRYLGFKLIHDEDGELIPKKNVVECDQSPTIDTADEIETLNTDVLEVVTECDDNSPIEPEEEVFVTELNRAIKKDVLVDFIDALIAKDVPYQEILDSFEHAIDTHTDDSYLHNTKRSYIISTISDNFRRYFSPYILKKFWTILSKNPSGTSDVSFEYLIETLPISELEDAVALNFSDLVVKHNIPDSSYFKYFKSYNSWNCLFEDNLSEFLNTCYDVDEVRDNVIYEFPELAPEVYDYLLNAYLNNYVTAVDITNIIDDILIPMADLERYQDCYFESIRNNVKEILYYTNSYSELYEAAKLLEDSEVGFGIPKEVIKPIVDSDIEWETNKIIEGSCYNFYNLFDFFMSPDAYSYFMDRLPEVLHARGLELYTLLIKNLGPLPEIINNHYCCKEFSANS